MLSIGKPDLKLGDSFFATAKERTW